MIYNKKKRKDKEYEKQWEEYRNAVYLSKVKSEDDFEKYINVLASGGVILGLTVIDKSLSRFTIVYLWIIVIALVFLVITLLSNLVSHYVSVFNAEKIVREIDSKEYEKVYENSKSRNDIIHRLNVISIVFLILGCSGIILFTTINLMSMSVDKQDSTNNKRVDCSVKCNTRLNESPLLHLNEFESSSSVKEKNRLDSIKNKF